MDFSRLPDHVFLQICGYLPLEDQIRARRVDKSFHRIGQLAILRTKFLNLTEDRFKNLNENQLALILDLCSPNLEMIKFPNDGENQIPLASMLANFEYQRLSNFDLGRSIIDYSIFDRIIRTVPKIESLSLYGNFDGFPNIVIDSLKILYLGYANDEILQSMTGRFPNLKEVYLIIEDSFTMDVLDEFFASVPQVHVVDIDMTNIDMIDIGINFDVLFEDELVMFWNLPLTSLRMKISKDEYYLRDSFLQKVVKSFPRLQSIRLCPIFSITDSPLGALPDLQILELGILQFSGVDNGLGQLIHCKKLRMMDFRISCITTATFIALFQSCPNLDHLIIMSIFGLNTPEEAGVVLQSLSAIGKRDITVEFCTRSKEFFKSVWESEPAKAAIKKLEEKDGLKIELGWIEMEDDEDEDEDMDGFMDDE